MVICIYIKFSFSSEISQTDIYVKCHYCQHTKLIKFAATSSADKFLALNTV